jgi:hypothetical protein
MKTVSENTDSKYAVLTVMRLRNEHNDVAQLVWLYECPICAAVVSHRRAHSTFHLGTVPPNTQDTEQVL